MLAHGGRRHPVPLMRPAGVKLFQCIRAPKEPVVAAGSILPPLAAQLASVDTRIGAPLACPSFAGARMPTAALHPRAHSMKILVPVKRVVDKDIKIRVKTGPFWGRTRQCEDVDEPLRRDARRGGHPAQGEGAGDRDRVRLDRLAASAETIRTGLPWAPTAAFGENRGAD